MRLLVAPASQPLVAGALGLVELAQQRGKRRAFTFAAGVFHLATLVTLGATRRRRRLTPGTRRGGAL